VVVSGSEKKEKRNLEKQKEKQNKKQKKKKFLHLLRRTNTFYVSRCTNHKKKAYKLYNTGMFVKKHKGNNCIKSKLLKSIKIRGRKKGS
jgi:hypothetical protein